MFKKRLVIVVLQVFYILFIIKINHTRVKNVRKKANSNYEHEILFKCFLNTSSDEK